YAVSFLLAVPATPVTYTLSLHDALPISRSTVDDSEESDTFDAVVVANGHYSVPYIPHVPNLSSYAAAHPTSVLHSKQFRSPNVLDRKSTRLNSSHVKSSYAVFCLKKKNK